MKDGTGGGCSVEGWKLPQNFHVTVLYIGNDPEKAEKSEIYHKFVEDKKIDIEINALLMVEERIITGICFPKCEIENDYPHMTMLMK